MPPPPHANTNTSFDNILITRSAPAPAPAPAPSAFCDNYYQNNNSNNRNISRYHYNNHNPDRPAFVKNAAALNNCSSPPAPAVGCADIHYSPPWVVLMAGAMGAGKTSTVSRLMKSGQLPLVSPVLVDLDVVRDLLPEASALKAVAPHLFGSVTQKEIGLIAELAVYRSLLSRRNVVLDSSLRNVDWCIEFIQKIGAFCKARHIFGVQFALIHVYCCQETAWKRVVARNELGLTGKTKYRINIYKQ
jgi:hypothetical protein